MPSSAPEPSSRLAAAIDDSGNLTPTQDGALAWLPPATLASDVLAEARSLVPALESELASMASYQQKKLWFGQLVQIISGATPAEEAALRIRALISDLDYPAMCFTDASRREVARRYSRYLPTYQQLCEVFDEIVAPRRRRLRRVKAIASGWRPPGTQNPVSSASEMQKFLADRNRRFAEAEQQRATQPELSAAASLKPIGNLVVRRPDQGALLNQARDLVGKRSEELRQAR